MRRSINATGQMNLPGYMSSLSEPPFPNPTQRGPQCTHSSPEHWVGGTRGAPGNEPPGPRPPRPWGVVYKKACASPAAPARRKAVGPSLRNLIAFPRLRSITPRRRQNEALKGPTGHTRPAGRGSSIIMPGPQLNAEEKGRLRASAQPVASPTPPGCVALG